MVRFLLFFDKGHNFRGESRCLLEKAILRQVFVHLAREDVQRRVAHLELVRVDAHVEGSALVSVHEHHEVRQV